MAQTSKQNYNQLIKLYQVMKIQILKLIFLLLEIPTFIENIRYKIFQTLEMQLEVFLLALNL